MIQLSIWKEMFIVNLRKIACDIAKELSLKNGGKPSEFMKEGWKLAKEGAVTPAPTQVSKPKEKRQETKAEPAEIKFYAVEYKMTKLGLQKSIIKAESPEKAKLKFNDPNDFTLQHEIKSCKQVKKVAKDWDIVFVRGNTMIIATAIKEVDLTKEQEHIGKLQGKNVTFMTSQILGANPPKKEVVLGKK